MSKHITVYQTLPFTAAVSFNRRYCAVDCEHLVQGRRNFCKLFNVFLRTDTSTRRLPLFNRCSKCLVSSKDA